AYNSVAMLRASAGGGEARCGSCLAALPAPKSLCKSLSEHTFTFMLQTSPQSRHRQSGIA
ncbi:MAG: hypothetical protein K2N86_02295, partial [Rikenellaceae bacterium]|nr:hypothetical protein [Rikenellaceae bacterium]